MRKLLFVLTTILLLSFLPEESFAQFREKGPKSGNYMKWAHKNYGHNGFKLNKGQRKSLGLKTGFLGTMLFANRPASKKKGSKSKSKPQNAKKD